MRRIVVFAGYDKAGIVHDYVLVYLRYLKEVADKIIFIADNHAGEQEQCKLKELVDYAEFKPHGEYDFGSYKRGYHYAKTKGWLEQADELILCNDSCFCVSSLTTIFEAMSKTKWDFWGMTKSHGIQDHLQSFFLVFTSNVFNSKVFVDHINSVVHKNDVMDVVMSYEIPFTAKLNKALFVDRGYVQFNNSDNPTWYPYKTYSKGMPLIKKKVFTISDFCHDPFWGIWKLLRKNTLFKECVEKYFSTNAFTLWGNICMRNFFNCVVRFFYQSKVTKHNRRIIKICKIPVYWRKV